MRRSEGRHPLQDLEDWPPAGSTGRLYLVWSRPSRAGSAHSQCVTQHEGHLLLYSEVDPESVIPVSPSWLNMLFREGSEETTTSSALHLVHLAYDIQRTGSSALQPTHYIRRATLTLAGCSQCTNSARTPACRSPCLELCCIHQGYGDTGAALPLHIVAQKLFFLF